MWFLQFCIIVYIYVHHFSHISLCYSFIPKRSTFIFYLKILHMTPHNTNVKKAYLSRFI